MRQLLPLLIMLGAVLTAFVPSALAQSSAIVEGVQMPAWIERAGQREPLIVGTVLKTGDAIRTGNGSRVLIKLVEGSLVRLGQNGLLHINEINPPIAGLFKASLRVADGAFRFTTDRLVRSRRREVTVAFAAVTTSVRGTDFWGKSTRDRQTVCLIEGKLEVGAEGEAPVTMDKARQFYRREKGVTQPVGLVNPTQLADWSREVDIETGGGAVRNGGTFSVLLTSADTEAAAFSVLEQARTSGFAADSQLVKFGARSVHQVVISSLPSLQEAEALAGKLRRQGFSAAKVDQIDQ